MHALRSLVSSIVLGSLALALPAYAQTAEDFAAMKKQLQELEAKVDKLEKEKADSTVDYGKSPVPIDDSSKIKLSTGITSLKLYGDLRFRYQFDQYQRQLDNPVTATGAALAGKAPNIDQRDRYRFRLRIGADFQLGDQFFGGVTLATGPQSDSNNQTYTEGYDNYNVYIDKAFAGWTPTEWLTIILGKQANPFYTTSLVWDPNITPTGAVEIFDISKAFLPGNSKLSLQLISMQGIFFDNNEFAIGNDNKSDAWQFVEQVKATYNINKDVSVTFAPGFMTYTAASLTGLANSLNFSKPSDVLTAPNGVQTQTTTTDTMTRTVKYDATGKPSITLTPVNVTTTTTITDPATGATRTVTTNTTNTQKQVTIPYGAKGNPLKIDVARANETFVSTRTSGGGTTTVTSPTGQSPTGETRDLAIITAPGDVSFKLGGIPTKVYWDFAYNTAGKSRASKEYFLTTHSTEDDFAWLGGFQLGANKRAGDWSFNANYRRLGMDSIDPNLDEVSYDLSYLNVQGVDMSVAYNFTDSLVGAVNYAHSWILNPAITGGEATGGSALANAKSVDVLQVDMNLKF
jgi:hypothetical protein